MRANQRSITRYYVNAAISSTTANGKVLSYEPICNLLIYLECADAEAYCWCKINHRSCNTQRHLLRYIVIIKGAKSLYQGAPSCLTWAEYFEAE